ncbi:MAG: hypothetical protein NC823_01565 [Candidatus Omnitrophica bacterium]|nr:hypothetical protein [Candidatus Omnitrophota bacterium]
MYYDVIVRICWLVITGCVIFLTVNLAVIFKRINRILKDVEGITSKINPVVNFLNRIAQATGKLISFLTWKVSRKKRESKN